MSNPITYSIYDAEIGLDKFFQKSLLTLDAPATDVMAAFSGSAPVETAVTAGEQKYVSVSQLQDGEQIALLSVAKKSFTDTTAGKFEGLDNGVYKWIIGDGTTSVDWNVTTANTLTVKGALAATTGTIGGFEIGSDYIRDVANSFGLASTVTGGDDIRIWAGAAYASRATAPFRVSEAGDVVANDITATGTINATGGYIGAANTALPIDSTGLDVGTTGRIAGGATNYDTGTGFWLGYHTAAYKFFIGTAAGAKLTWDGSALAVTGAITATSGSITGAFTVGGALTVSTSGSLGSGQTAYNTGTGWWLEYNAGTPRLSIGDGSAGNSLTWDGTSLKVNGSPIEFTAIYGSGEDGDATISGNTSLTQDMFYNNLTINTGVTLTTNGYRVSVAGTLTLSGTAKIAWNGNNGTNGGNATADVGGTAGTGGAALTTANNLWGSEDGKNGTAGATGPAGGSAAGSTNGTNGDSVTEAVGGAGVAGATGGSGGRSSDSSLTGGGGTPGTAGAGTLSVFRPYNIVTGYYMTKQDGTKLTSFGGSGGSTGGGSGGGSGVGGIQGGGGGGAGGSGSGGGVMVLCAKIIAGTGSIEVKGGTGGNGGNGGNGEDGGGRSSGGGGGGAGGSGGSGGVLVLVYKTKASGITVSVAGGAGGTGGTGGQPGTVAPAAAGSSGATGVTGQTGVLIELIT